MGPKLLMKVLVLKLIRTHGGTLMKLLSRMTSLAVILNVKRYAIQDLSATTFHTAKDGPIVYYAPNVISRRVETQGTTHLGQKQVRGIQKVFSNRVIAIYHVI